MNTNVTSSGERLKQLMAQEGLRQSDIVDLCKPFAKRYGVPITKSDISSYCTGRSDPSQKKLFILAQALHVSEAWLMGLDVAKEPRNTISDAKKDIDLLSKFNSLKKRDQLLVTQIIDILLSANDA